MYIAIDFRFVLPFRENFSPNIREIHTSNTKKEST